MTAAAATKEPKKAKGKELDQDVVFDAFAKAAKAEDQIRILEGNVEECRQELKDAKARLNGAQANLRKIIRETAHPEDHPLFAKADKAERAAKNGAKPVPINPDDDQSWKDVQLSAALPDLAKGVLQKLNDAQLWTMGELANYTSVDGGRKRLTDIPGIGEGAVAKIEEATTQFWAKRAAAIEQVKAVATATATEGKPAEPATPSEAQAAAAEAKPADGDESVKERVARQVEEDRPMVEFRSTPFSKLIGAGKLCKILTKAKLKTIGDVEYKAKQDGASILDTLRGLGMEIMEAQMIIEQMDAIDPRRKEGQQP